MSSMERIHLDGGRGRYALHAEALRLGPDVQVTIGGGGAPHVGAVAAASPRPSGIDPAKLGATASVLTFLGHKEDELAREMALYLAARLGAGWWSPPEPIGRGSVRRESPRCARGGRQLMRRLGELLAPPAGD